VGVGGRGVGDGWTGVVNYTEVPIIGGLCKTFPYTGAV
jgi:hypothetical protein